MPKATPKKSVPAKAEKPVPKKADPVVVPKVSVKKPVSAVVPKTVAKKPDPVPPPKLAAKRIDPTPPPPPKPTAKKSDSVPPPKVAAKRIDPVVEFLRRLAKDDPKVMTEFVIWAVEPIRSPKEVERIHEFVEEAEHRIRNSRSKLDRVAAARALLGLFRDHSRRLGINERFLATICGALCTYFQNRKIWDPAIESCEFLVGRAIPDEDGVGFHKKLDWLYRQRARRAI